jgi:hypothetical protein
MAALSAAQAIKLHYVSGVLTLMDWIDPCDLLGLLDRLDIEIDNDGFVVAAHEDTFERLTLANNLSNVTVGTTHISMAAIASAWFRRKVFQDCDGGLRPRTMYLETVD